PGRRATGKVRGRLNETAIEAVRGAELVAVVAAFGSRAAVVVCFAGDEAGDGDEIVRVRDEDAAGWVKGAAAPSHAADDSGHHQRSLHAWRRENAFIEDVRCNCGTSRDFRESVPRLGRQKACA